MSSAEVPRLRYINDLGKGAFGCVVLAQNIVTQELVAVKKVPLHLTAHLQLERELLSHSSLRHPHIVRFRHVFLSPHHCNLVLEYVPDGTLLQHVQAQGSLPEPQARWLFQQLILAVEYCHRRGIGNRDIKLDNILLDKSTKGRPEWPIAKICDWGFARYGTTSEACSRVGTPSYMAPEVLRSSSYSTKRADVWSCGIVLYAMMCGRMPFAVPVDQTLGQQLEKLAQDMQQQRYRLPEGLSEGAKDIIQRLLQPNPDARIDIAGILAHPWFQVNLPREALTMNERFLQLPRSCSQSEDEILRISAAAHRQASAGAAGAVALMQHVQVQPTPSPCVIPVATGQVAQDVRV